MSPTRWVLPRAISLVLLAVTFVATILRATPVSAQYFDPALQSLGLSTGSVARSPRLLGMGGMSLAVPDRNTSFNLWDFAAMPVGISTNDSTSSLDLRPGTDAMSSVRELPTGRERQNLAARTTLAQYEAVYRNRQSGSVFALVGDVSNLRWDSPYASDSEVRQSVLRPAVMPVLGGVVPRFLSGHLAWAAHMRFRNESLENHLRSIVSNSAGEYIDLAGGQLPPPGEFLPVNTTVKTIAYGVSTAYTLGHGTRLGLGIEREKNDLFTSNDQLRSSYDVREERPYWVGHAALVGSLGHTFEYGVDGVGRLSDSEQDWRFTASAGVGADPLTGRGNLLTREEKSSEMRVRARWTPGRAAFAGAFNTGAGKITVDAPNANDVTSLNRFINQAFNRTGADTLALPDSVIHGVSERYAYGWGGGASYRFGTSTLGLEGNWLRDIRSTTLLGSGPRRIEWDIRAGAEHPLGAQMKARLGYVYHWLDEDDLTAGNEYKGNALSFGLGYQPELGSWDLESGYLLEFRNQDSESASALHQSRHNLAIQLHWAF